MFRYITPIILVGIAVTGFMMFTKPILSDITNLKTEIASYNEALDNAKALENERDKLTKKYSSINPDDLTKLQKLLPDNVDNIRLILEVEKLALPYGMSLKDVKYDATVSDKTSKDNTTPKTTTPPNQVVGNVVSGESNKEYGTWTLEFSTEGTYSNFISFLKDLESNLRIVDISSITFSSETGSAVGKTIKPADMYKYSFKIKTYWLKN